MAKRQRLKTIVKDDPKTPATELAEGELDTVTGGGNATGETVPKPRSVDKVSANDKGSALGDSDDAILRNILTNNENLDP